jgi:uncharacterized protein (DUF697 family)
MVTMQSGTEDGLVGDKKVDKAAEIISSSVAWSVGAGLVPMPVLDLIALGAVQTRMLMDLSEVYDQSFSKESARAIVSVLLGTLAPGVATGALIGSSIKFAPIAGSLTGMITMAAFGAASTYAVGKVFIRHLNAGGTVGSFSAEAIKDDLKKEFQVAAAKQASK